MVFSACFVLSPAAIDTLWFVTVGTELSSFGFEMLALCPLTPATGVRTTRLGPARKGVATGRISTPAATRSAVVSFRSAASRYCRFPTRPLYKERVILRARALATFRRPDAAASTASRPASHDDRDTPLIVGRDQGNIVL